MCLWRMHTQAQAQACACACACARVDPHARVRCRHAIDKGLLFTPTASYTYGVIMPVSDRTCSTRTRTRTRTCTRTCTYMHVHTCTCTCTRAHADVFYAAEHGGDVRHARGGRDHRQPLRRRGRGLRRALLPREHGPSAPTCTCTCTCTCSPCTRSCTLSARCTGGRLAPST